MLSARASCKLLIQNKQYSNNSKEVLHAYSSLIVENRLKKVYFSSLCLVVVPVLRVCGEDEGKKARRRQTTPVRPKIFPESSGAGEQAEAGARGQESGRQAGRQASRAEGEGHRDTYCGACWGTLQG